MQMQERETAVQKQNQEKGITVLHVLPWRQDGGNNVGIVKAVLRCIVSSQMVSLVEGVAPRTLAPRTLFRMQARLLAASDDFHRLLVYVTMYV
jgi:hypothetical protein